jgi:hypothetical protein
MPYWMKSPEGAVMPCYSVSDMEQVKVHGWSLMNEGDSPLREAPQGSVEAEAPLPDPAPVRKKPGPKPKAK